MSSNKPGNFYGEKLNGSLDAKALPAIHMHSVVSGLSDYINIAYDEYYPQMSLIECFVQY